MKVEYKQFRPGLLDLRTLGLMVLMTAGLVVLFFADLSGAIPPFVSILLGCLLMNLSFTAWHEPCHGNFSSSRGLNHLAGVIASFASVYPGYFARRREHLIHHRWEGDPKLDPVYPRIQTTFWNFPVLLASLTVNRSGQPEAWRDFLPITGPQKWLDRFSNALAFTIVLVCFYKGFGGSILAVWIIPRAIIFLVHAFYVCFFAHSIQNGGFQILRIRRNWFYEILTVGQSLHGIHHKWPFVPWYRYHAVASVSNQELSQIGMEVVSGNSRVRGTKAEAII